LIAPDVTWYGVVITTPVPMRIDSVCVFVLFDASVTRNPTTNKPSAVGVPDSVKLFRL
jgi:hypothetical protein